MPLASWLFVKDSASIWVERPYGRVLIVAGPGAVRDEREFITENALQAHQVTLAERLAADGWILWGIDQERRARPERRQAPRGTTDRRYGSARR